MCVASLTWAATLFSQNIAPLGLSESQSVIVAFSDGSTATSQVLDNHLVYLGKDGNIAILDYVVVNHNSPTPKPQPDPQPKPQPGPQNLRVLILYESEDLITMPPEQAAILTSVALREYLDKHCPNETLDKSKTSRSYRFYDKDDDMSKAPSVWAQTVKYAKEKNIPVPSILIVGTERELYSGPLPESVDKTLELLRKYGG